MRGRNALVAVLAATFVWALAAPSGGSRLPARSGHSVVEACPFARTAGDQLSRGFYVSGFSGHNIHTVTLAYSGSGRFAVTLTARKRRYDGELLGRSTTPRFRVTGGSTKVKFDFGDVAVDRGSTVAFTQHAVGRGRIYYNVGRGPLGDRSYDRCPGIIETEGHAPPRDRFRRASVGLEISAVHR